MAIFALIFLGALALAKSQDCNGDCSCLSAFKGSSGRNKSVAEAFEKFGIVKDYLPVPPKDYLYTEFKTVTINLGNFVSPLRALDAKRIDYQKKKKGALYTLLYVGVDPNLATSQERGYINYLVMNMDEVKLPIYAKHKNVVVPFVPALPSLGMGRHRSMAVLYEQKGEIDTDPMDLIRMAQHRNIPKIEEFAKKYNLGNPVAGNFFVTELRHCGMQ